MQQSNEMIPSTALDLYDAALPEAWNDKEFGPWVRWMSNRKKPDVDLMYFLHEYVFVVISSGMKQQIARQIYNRWTESGYNCAVIGHPGKREAIKRAAAEGERWLTEWNQSADKVEYLETLPWIGPVTKWHLAKNLGVDCVKPDRHLERIAAYYGFPSSDSLCSHIATAKEVRKSFVDSVLWVWSNHHGTQSLVGR